eukprot:1183377-Prorocentrum_minimum.AAC.3
MITLFDFFLTVCESFWQVAAIKGGAAAARAHAKLASKTEAGASKLDAKAQETVAKAEAKVWTARHEAMLKWREAAKKLAGKDKALDLNWWKAFNRNWGKDFLSLAAMRALWAEVPEPQRPLFQPVHDKAQAQLQVGVHMICP